ncbi:unnamed protein product [Arabidopsis arenosa]|uniref:Uncharacterized protein n=1 Tax=Arabidopsis arenosa TaxID=38785 RepID=A0A8S1ZKW8_ARAAE|nr:unnamed protein product [Arabidopsis arenosa]
MKERTHRRQMAEVLEEDLALFMSNGTITSCQKLHLNDISEALKIKVLKICCCNWFPTTNDSYGSKGCARIVYMVMNKLKFDFGRLVFDHIFQMVMNLVAMRLVIVVLQAERHCYQVDSNHQNANWLSLIERTIKNMVSAAGHCGRLCLVFRGTNVKIISGYWYVVVFDSGSARCAQNSSLSELGSCIRSHQTPELLTWKQEADGGEPDLMTGAKMILHDWQRGCIPFFVPPPEVDDVVAESEATVPGIDEEAIAVS